MKWTHLPNDAEHCGTRAFARLATVALLQIASLVASLDANALTAQTISFAALSGKTFGVAPFSVSATTSSGLAVGFSSLTVTTCSVAGATVTIVAAGTCTIQASQAGNASYAAALTVNQTFTVAKAAQTIAFAALPGKTYGAAPFAISASASSGLPVNFVSATTAVCTVSGATVTIVAGGTCTIQARQSGNGNFNAATSVNQGFAVAKAAQSITFAALAGKTYGNPPFAVSATASSGLAVTFTSTTTTVCTITGSTVTIKSGGPCTITAAQAGNASYSAAPNVSQSFAVAKASQSIAFAAVASQTYGAAPFTVSATASSALTVTFSSLTTIVCTASGAMVTIKAAGTCTIQAAQAGNTSYSAASNVSQSFTVAKASQAITFGALADRLYGAAPFTVSATASSNLVVTFSSLTTSVCTTSGSTVSVVAAGTCTVQAAQVGNGNYNAAPNASQGFSVGQATQTVTFPSPGNKLFAPSPIFLSAAASSGLPVGFSSLSPTVCTVSGTTATLVAVGTCAIQAAQPGNGSYLAAPAVTQSFVVMAAPRFSVARIYATDMFPTAITAEDFSGDGKADLAIANSLASDVSILIGNGDGTFVTNAAVHSGGSTGAVAIGDFNTDGKLDLAIGNISGNAITVYSGNGNGTFTLRSTVNVSAPISIAVADLNSDGKADLIVANGTYGNTTGQTVTVVLGSGDGSFRAPVSYTTGPSPYGVVVGDFNGDRKPDLAVVNGDNNSVSILLGVGNGTFNAAVNYLTGSYPDAIAIGDFNADGKLDLAIGNDFSNDVSILLGNGDGTFGPATSFPAGSGPASLAVADFNGDGWADVAISNRFDDSIVVLIGNGDGTFQSALTFGAGGHPNALISKDLNGDGKPDLVAANAYDNTISIFTNTSTFIAVGSISIQAGSPQVATVSTAFSTPFSVIVRDSGNSPLSGAVVAFTAPTIGQTGTFIGGSSVARVVTGPLGVAAAPSFTANATSGLYSVIASAGASSAIFALNNAATLQPPVFTSGPQPDGAVDTPYSSVITATGTPAPTFSVATGTLPPGLTLDDVFGVIEGTPSSAGTFAGSLTATNTIAPDATQGFIIIIARSPQTINFGSYANSALGSGPITISATASSGLPVGFVSLTTPVCTVVGNTVNLLSVGLCTLQAGQAGSSNYLAAANVNQSFSVTPQSQAIAFSPLSSKAVNSIPFTVSATASSALPVAFASLTLGTCTVSGATVTLAAQGTCTIRATQSGSASFAAATPVDQSFAISTGAFLQYTYDAAGNVIKIERVGSR